MFYGPFVQQSLQLLCQQMHSFRFHGSGDHAVETRRPICKLNPVAFLYSPFYHWDIFGSSFHAASFSERGTSFDTSLWWGDVRCVVSWNVAGSNRTRNISLETAAPRDTSGDGDWTTASWGCQEGVIILCWNFSRPSRGARKPQDFFLEEMMLLRSGLFEADCEARRAAPQSLRGGTRFATLSFCASRLKGTGPGRDRVADVPDSWARRGRNLTNASS